MPNAEICLKPRPRNGISTGRNEPVERCVECHARSLHTENSNEGPPKNVKRTLRLTSGLITGLEPREDQIADHTRRDGLIHPVILQLNPEHFGEVLAVERAAATRATGSAALADDGLGGGIGGDQFFVIDAAQQKQQFGLSVEAGADAVHGGGDVFAHTGPVGAAALVADLSG